MLVVSNLSSWFSERLSTIKCSDDTKAYVISVFDKHKTSENDLSSSSIILAYVEARKTFQFSSFQTIGDWSLWSLSMRREIHNKQVLEEMGRQSYATCHHMLRKQWALYEELAYKLPIISDEIAQKIF